MIIRRSGLDPTAASFVQTILRYALLTIGVVTALNDYNVAMELRAWLDDEKQHVSARTSLRERLFEALRAAEVDMPYETFALAPIEVRGKLPV